MTDNEIIKTYEYCINHDYCEGCICVTNNTHCVVNKPKLALDLFKRYEAKLEEAEDTIQYADKEIKRLNEEINRQKATIEALQFSVQAISGQLSTGKAEAIKEFAERLCKDRVVNDPVVFAVQCELKEMEGEV